MRPFDRANIKLVCRGCGSIVCGGVWGDDGAQIEVIGDCRPIDPQGLEDLCTCNYNSQAIRRSVEACDRSSGRVDRVLGSTRSKLRLRWVSAECAARVVRFACSGCRLSKQLSHYLAFVHIGRFDAIRGILSWRIEMSWCSRLSTAS